MNAPARPTNELVYRIQERYGDLRKSERIVADYLRENECDDIKVRASELTLLVRDIITSTQRESKTAATNHAEFKADPEK